MPRYVPIIYPDAERARLRRGAHLDVVGETCATRAEARELLEPEMDQIHAEGLAASPAIVELDDDGTITDYEVLMSRRENSGYRVSPNLSLPVAPRNHRWDARAADKRVRRMLGVKSKATPEYRRCFFAYRGSGLTGGKLPFCDVVDGELMMVPRALSAVQGALHGARGGIKLPSSVRAKVQKKLDMVRRDNPGAFGEDAGAVRVTVSDPETGQSWSETLHSLVIAHQDDAATVRGLLDQDWPLEIDGYGVVGPRLSNPKKDKISRERARKLIEPCADEADVTVDELAAAARRRRAKKKEPTVHETQAAVDPVGVVADTHEALKRETKELNKEAQEKVAQAADQVAVQRSAAPRSFAVVLMSDAGNVIYNTGIDAEKLIREGRKIDGFRTAHAAILPPVAPTDEKQRKAIQENIQRLARQYCRTLAPSSKAEKDQWKTASGRTVSVWLGAETQVIVPHQAGLQMIDARYALVPIDAVTPSHNAQTFAPSKHYPKELQERDYQNDRGEQLKVERGANKLEPSLVLNSNPDAINGPPVVGPLLRVLGGNSRAMMIQRNYASAKTKYNDAMRSELADHCAKFGLEGLTAAQTKGKMLVRIISGEYDPITISSDLNRSLTQTAGRASQAVSLASRLPASMYDTIAAAVSEGASLREAIRDSEQELISELRRADVINARNQADFLEQRRGKARLTARGELLLVDGMVGGLVADKEVLSRAERATLNWIERVAAPVLAIHAVDPENRHGYDLLAAMRQAIHAYMPIQGANDAEFRAYWSNTSLVDERDPAVVDDANPLAAILLRYLHENRRRYAQSARSLAEYLRAIPPEVTGKSGMLISRSPDELAAMGLGPDGLLERIGLPSRGVVRTVGARAYLAGASVEDVPPTEAPEAREDEQAPTAPETAEEVEVEAESNVVSLADARKARQDAQAAKPAASDDAATQTLQWLHTTADNLKRSKSRAQRKIAEAAMLEQARKAFSEIDDALREKLSERAFFRFDLSAEIPLVQSPEYVASTRPTGLSYMPRITIHLPFDPEQPAKAWFFGDDDTPRLLAWFPQVQGDGYEPVLLSPPAARRFGEKIGAAIAGALARRAYELLERIEPGLGVALLSDGSTVAIADASFKKLRDTSDGYEFVLRSGFYGPYDVRVSESAREALVTTGGREKAASYDTVVRVLANVLNNVEYGVDVRREGPASPVKYDEAAASGAPSLRTTLERERARLFHRPPSRRSTYKEASEYHLDAAEAAGYKVAKKLKTPYIEATDPQAGLYRVFFKPQATYAGPGRKLKDARSMGVDRRKVSTEELLDKAAAQALDKAQQLAEDAAQDAALDAGSAPPEDDWRAAAIAATEAARGGSSTASASKVVTAPAKTPKRKPVAQEAPNAERAAMQAARAILSSGKDSRIFKRLSRQQQKALEKAEKALSTQKALSNVTKADEQLARRMVKAVASELKIPRRLPDIPNPWHSAQAAIVLSAVAHEGDKTPAGRALKALQSDTKIVRTGNARARATALTAVRKLAEARNQNPGMGLTPDDVGTDSPTAPYLPRDLAEMVRPYWDGYELDLDAAYHGLAKDYARWHGFEADDFEPAFFAVEVLAHVVPDEDELDPEELDYAGLTLPLARALLRAREDGEIAEWYGRPRAKLKAIERVQRMLRRSR